jgi:hypothetical protein
MEKESQGKANSIPVNAGKGLDGGRLHELANSKRTLPNAGKANHVEMFGHVNKMTNGNTFRYFYSGRKLL